MINYSTFIWSRSTTVIFKVLAGGFAVIGELIQYAPTCAAIKLWEVMIWNEHLKWMILLVGSGGILFNHVQCDLDLHLIRFI